MTYDKLWEILENLMLVLQKKSKKIPEEFSKFHKEALREVPKEYPFRGPKYYSSKDFLYINDVQGNVENFSGAERVIYTVAAEKDIQLCEEIGLDKLPICIAKTPYSLSDDPQLLGRPEGFKITVREIKFSAGAGFLVPMTGKITTMPGLPAKPTSEMMDIDDEGNISGLY